MILALACLASFATGVLVGVFVVPVRVARIEARAIRQTVTMTHDAVDRLRRVPWRVLGVAAVTAALAANVALGFLLIGTRAALEEGAERDEARLACQIRYNALKGVALEERDAAVKAGSSVEFDLWTAIRDDLASGSLTGEGLVNRIDDYRAEIREQQATRYRNPYPPSDLCEGIAPGDPLPPLPSEETNP